MPSSTSVRVNDTTQILDKGVIFQTAVENITRGLCVHPNPAILFTLGISGKGQNIDPYSLYRSSAGAVRYSGANSFVCQSPAQAPAPSPPRK